MVDATQPCVVLLDQSRGIGKILGGRMIFPPQFFDFSVGTEEAHNYYEQALEEGFVLLFNAAKQTIHVSSCWQETEHDVAPDFDIEKGVGEVLALLNIPDNQQKCFIVICRQAVIL